LHEFVFSLISYVVGSFTDDFSVTNYFVAFIIESLELEDCIHNMFAFVAIGILSISKASVEKEGAGGAS
jgi:hypothetical protein